MDYEFLQRLVAVLKEAGAPMDGAKVLFERRNEFLVPFRSQDGEIEAGILDRVAPAFDALELMIMVCRAVSGFWLPDASLTAEDLMTADSERSDWGLLALTRLFHAGILAAAEVLNLMRGGFRTGAYARWRALHEATTRAQVISRAHDLLEETARRYVLHDQYRENAWLSLARGLHRRDDPNDELGFRDTIREWELVGQSAAAEFGQTFTGDYGWADGLLIARSDDYARRSAKCKRVRGPILRDLVDFIGATEPAGRALERRNSPLYWEYLYTLANGVKRHRMMSVHRHRKMSVRWGRFRPSRADRPAVV